MLWGISGSISIYKIPDILSYLKKYYHIQVVMTKCAVRFINPIIFENVTENPVYVNLFNPPMIHTKLINNIDIFVIAPATYNIIGKISSGIANDLLSCVASLAGNSKNIEKFIAPAMNSNMLENSIFCRNLKILKKYNQYKILKTDYGKLACGKIGFGKLRNKEALIQFFLKKFKKKPQRFQEKKILVTAGGIFEKIDPIRCIGNLSSGKMGISLAKAFKKESINVELIYSNISVAIPKDIESYYVESTTELLELLKKKIESIDILVMAAAVSDYIPSSYYLEKEKKENLELQFKLNMDVLKILAMEKKENQIFIGFSAGSGNLEKQIAEAKSKLIDKNLDMIIQNSIDRKGIGINSDYNEAHVIIRNCNTVFFLKKKRKSKISSDILNIVHRYFF